MDTMGSNLLAAMLQKTNNAISYHYNLWTDLQPTKTMALPFMSTSLATTATMTTTSSEEERAHFEKILQCLTPQEELPRNEEFSRLFPGLRTLNQPSAEKAARVKATVAEDNLRNYSYTNVQQQQQPPQQQLQNYREKDEKDDLDDSEQQRKRFWSTLTSKLPDNGQIKRESLLQHHLYEAVPAAEVEQRQQQQQQQQQQQIEAEAWGPPGSTMRMPAWVRKKLPKTKYSCRVCKKEFFKSRSVETHMILVHNASSNELTSNDESSFRSSAEREFRLAPDARLEPANKLSSVSSYPYYDDGVVEDDYYHDDEDDEDDDVFNFSDSSNGSDEELAPDELDECQRIYAEEMLLKRQQSTDMAEKNCHLCKYCKLPFFYFNNYVEHLRASHCFESELGARDTSTPMIPAGNADDSFQLPQPGTQLLLASSYKYEDDRKTPATPPPPPPVAQSRTEVASPDQNDYNEEVSCPWEQPRQTPVKEQEQNVILNCVMCHTFFFSMGQLNQHVKQYHGPKAAL